MEQDMSFGRWLQQRRKSLALTQADLGAQVACSAAMIRKIEADERRPSKDMAALLAQQLKLAPEEHDAFLSFARGEAARAVPPLVPQPHAASLPKPVASTRSSLPIPLTPLIDREEQVAHGCSLLQRRDVRLLTLLGIGGIGKTRLSIAIAATLAHHYDDVHFVALAAIRTPALVTSAIAQTLGVKESVEQSLLDNLVEYFQHTHQLLLLDNFEHVVLAASFVAELLAHVPNLNVLVTSRCPLHVSGEYEILVPPLGLPDPQHLVSLDARIQSPAVALFVERSQAVQSTFQLTAANAADVAAICHHLDGLPLAIELAAARSKLFTPQALLTRLSNRLTFLTRGACNLPIRQQTLRNTIDWSYDLLSPDEQTLFRRLAVFVGGRTPPAVNAICNSARDLSVDLVNGLHMLLDNSLLIHQVGADGEPRFLMLQTLREYALEKLVASGEYEALRRTHAFYYLAFAEVAEPELTGSQQQYWLDQLEQEHDNLRAALQWSQVVEGGTEIGLRLASALAWFWYVRGYWREGREHLTEALVMTSGPTIERAKAFNTAGWLASCMYDDAAAHAAHTEALAISRQLGEKQGIAKALRGLGDVALNQGQYDQARVLHEQCLALYRELERPLETAGALNGLGEGARCQNDYARAATLYDESLVLYQKAGNTRGIAVIRTNQGFVAYHQGEHTQATKLFEEGLRLSNQLKEDVSVAACLVGLAGTAAINQPAWAAHVLGGADALLSAIGGQLDPPDRIEYVRVHKVVRAHLDEVAFTAAWEAGRTMTPEQARAVWNQAPPVTPEDTTSLASSPSVTTARQRYPAGLTVREVEVLRLVAQGHSDAEVAEHLVISPRTVNAHLTSIYRKLDVTSRTAAAHFVIHHELV